MGEYIREQEEQFEERKDPTVRDVTKEIPFKYYIAIAVLGIMVYVLYRQEKASIWHLVIVGIILFVILRSATDILDLRKQHTQGEAIMITYREIKKQILDKEIKFPKGHLVMTGVARPVTYEKENQQICKEIRVPFDIIEDSGLPHSYVASVHPYEPWVMGVEIILKQFRGDEFPHIKYIIPAQPRIEQRFFKGRL